MTIRDIIKKDDPKNLEFLSIVNNYLDELSAAINNPLHPAMECYSCFKNKLGELSESYFNCTGMLFYHQQLKKHNINTVIGRSSKDLVKFDINTFKAGSFFEIGLLINKYPGLVNEGQVKLGIIKMLFANGLCWELKDEIDVETREFKRIVNWVELLKNIKKNIDIVLDSDTANIPSFDNTSLQEQFNSAISNTKINVAVINRPRTREHLQPLFKEGMTRPECVKAVADYYKVGQKQATRYMKEFGLWENQFPKSFEDLYKENLEIIEEQKQIISNLEDNIDKLNENIAMLKADIVRLNKKIDVLKGQAKGLNSEHNISMNNANSIIKEFHFNF